MGDVAAVEIDGLRYAFGAKTAVDGVDLRIAPGEVFGLLGPNGAGKTTTIRLIVTLLPCPPGAVRVFGHRWRGPPSGRGSPRCGRRRA